MEALNLFVFLSFAFICFSADSAALSIDRIHIRLQGSPAPVRAPVRATVLELAALIAAHAMVEDLMSLGRQQN